LSAALVAVFSIRELDLAVLIPAANPSAAVRYYNALHFARDGFVAAFGLMIALVLFLPVALHSLWNGLNQNKS
jgi:ABC-type Fe3+ transport system permease subunit